MSSSLVRAAISAVLEGASACDLESQTLDFKTVGRSLPDTLAMLAQTAACFANSDGGTIVVGVHDRASGSAALVGSTLDPDQVRRRIMELTDPALICGVEVLDWSGTPLTVIEVPRGLDVHQVKGVAPERVGASCHTMTAKRIAQVVQSRSGDDWSADDTSRSVSEVDPLAMALTRRRLVELSGARASWAGQSDGVLLTRLGLSSDGRSLNRAGVLLLTHASSLRIDYTRRRLRSGELAMNERITGPGLEGVIKVLDLIDSTSGHTPVILRTGTQLLVADVPQVAVREAVVNAVMHRDYRARGPIQIEHADDVISVRSPGGFVAGVGVDNLLVTKSTSRNATLVSALRMLALGEAAGVGIDRMLADTLRYGHPAPGFESDGGHVTVTLRGGPPDVAWTRFVHTLPSERVDDPDTLVILTHLLTHRTVDAHSVREQLQKPIDQVDDILGSLAAELSHLIEQTPKSRTWQHPVYRFTSDAVATLGELVAYRSRSMDVGDRIVNYVRDFDEVTSKVVQTMTNVQPATASRYLSDLVQRGILVRTSAAARGPSVTYGKGPKFPPEAKVRRSARRAKKTSKNEPTHERTADE